MKLISSDRVKHKSITVKAKPGLFTEDADGNIVGNVVDLEANANAAEADAQRWAQQPGGEALGRLRERDATQLRRWAREASRP